MFYPKWIVKTPSATFEVRAINKFRAEDFVKDRLPIGDTIVSVERKHPKNRQGYCPVAVNKAIASSNRAGRKISGSEARKIHALLRGSVAPSFDDPTAAQREFARRSNEGY